MKLCWFMRGGVTYQEALNLSPDEREIIGKLVKENLETTKKTGQPFFQNIILQYSLMLLKKLDN